LIQKIVFEDTTYSGAHLPSSTIYLRLTALAPDIFNKLIISKRLEQLSPTASTAFSAAIATRMMPIYTLAIPGETSDLESALEQAWDYVLEANKSLPDCQKQLDVTMNLIQRVPTKAGKFKLYAEDSIAAVAYTLRTIVFSNPEEAIWTAQRMFETVTRHLQEKNSYSLQGSELIEKIISEPLMQAEFARQFEDLDELKKWNLENGLAIKKRARASQVLPNDLC